MRNIYSSKQGFSLMEMLVVLLIVAIVAAVSAPMITKKMVRGAGNSSPWVWIGLSGNIGYNIDNQNRTAIIGTSDAGNVNSKFLVKSTDTTPQIALAGQSGDLLRILWNNGTLWMSEHNMPAFVRGASVVTGTFINPSNISAASGAVAIGGTVSGMFPTAVGSNSSAGVTSVAVGHGAIASVVNSTALGNGANAVGNSVAVGQGSTARVGNSTALGYNAQAMNGGAIALGFASVATDTNTIALGNSASAGRGSAIAIGAGTVASDIGSIAIGAGANTNANSTGSIAIGAGATTNASATGGIAIGSDSTAATASSIAIGNEANASGSSSAQNSVAIGRGATANGTDSVAIGHGATTNVDDQIVLGTRSSTVYIPARLVVGRDTTLALHDGIVAVRAERGASGGHDTTHMGSLWTDATIHIAGERNLKISRGRDARLIYGWGSAAFPVGSDRRLKNVGEAFKGGLAELKKIEIFNFNYKKDPEKVPHVGVMAQDLMKIFPEAVWKGDDGFYRIRMEDMFYAVINAVKELDEKITGNSNRIAELEKQNAEQQKMIDALIKKVEKLEKKAK